MKSWITTDFQQRETSLRFVLKIGDVVERSKSNQHLVEDVFLMKFHEVDEFQRGKISETPTFSKKNISEIQRCFLQRIYGCETPHKISFNFV